MRLLWSLLLLAASVLWGQGSGIQGVVFDATGAVIPGAVLKVTNADTGVATTRKANEVGFYSAPSLGPGRYKVECQAEGLAPQEKEIRLEVGQVARLDFKLNVGAVSERIEVSVAGVLLESETTTVGQVIDGKRILEMPLNGRNYLELAQFTVGVLPSRQLGKGHRTGDEGGFQAVGMHVFQNTVLLDGNDNSSRSGGGPLGFQAQAVKPPVDAVAEFKVVTNNTSAEYGYRAGAKVLVSTRSGANQLHGSLYEFLRNDKLDGTNFFANRSGSTKPTYRQNQFGGTLGGPVIRNRTFFFGSFQGTRIREGQSFISSVPSREAINGDFSRQPPTRRNIFDPLTITGAGANAVRQPFPGNRVPANRFDPVAKTVADIYPAPNIAGLEHLPNNYFFSPSESDDADQHDFRVDHNFSDNDRFFVRYSIRNQLNIEPGPLPVPALGGDGQTVRLDGDNVVANYSRALSATMFNEFRIGWSHFPTSFDIPVRENLNKKFGIRGAPGDTFNDGLDHGYSNFSPSGFRQLGPRGWPNLNNLDNLLLADSFTIQKRRHSVKLGGEFRRANLYRIAARSRRGSFNFGGVYTAERPNDGVSRANTGNGLADMLLGWASGGTISTMAGENLVSPYYGLFVQDDWKVSNRLTLNVGLRWELFPGPTLPNPEKQTVSRYLMDIHGVPRPEERFVFPKNGSDCGCEHDWNNFAPRLGLAYRWNDKTVLRAGAGIYYGEPDAVNAESSRFRTGPPKRIEQSLDQPRERSSLIVERGFPPLVTGIVPPNVSVEVVPDFLPSLYAGQWFFDIQRNLPGDTLITVGYNGSGGVHLYTDRNLNYPLTPHPTTRWQDRKIRPEFNNLTLAENVLNASFQSLTVKAERRFTRGLTFLSAFTWAHNIDYGSENLEQNASGRASEYNLKAERSSSNLDRRLAYSLSFLYEFPLGKGKAWLRSGPGSWLLGSWQIGGILSLLTGTPNDHSINVDRQNNGGRARGDWVRSPDLPAGQRSIDRWFDTEFVAPSAPGLIGSAGRNLVYGPGRRHFDFILAKNFVTPWEGHALEFRFESFNFTNTAKFGRPDVAVGTPGVGRISQAEDPRRIQFGLKYVF
ncbi:MAG: TonB-dependent receptor [Acidobacteriota bacterium]